MSASIKGRVVVWAIPAGVITAGHTATESGILQSFTLNSGGEVTNVGDEENDQVTRIDHGKLNTGSVEILCEPDSVLPAKGDELTGLGTIDGIAFGTGRVFVEEASVAYANAQVKKITVPFTHYPDMPADD